VPSRSTPLAAARGADDPVPATTVSKKDGVMNNWSFLDGDCQTDTTKKPSKTARTVKEKLTRDRSKNDQKSLFECWKQ
jgi:hypothetical protein